MSTLLAFPKRHMDRVAEGLPDLFSDVFAQADNVARRSHSHDLPVVRHTVEGGMNQQTPLAK